MVASSEAGESVSAPLTGTLDQALAAWLPETELTFAALEVGTLPLAGGVRCPAPGQLAA